MEMVEEWIVRLLCPKSCLDSDFLITYCSLTLDFLESHKALRFDF